jgi:hypothetical protein
MIDHVLGRPSVQFRKIQVLAVVSFWSFYLYRQVLHTRSHTHTHTNKPVEATAMAHQSSAAYPPSSPRNSPSGNPSS